jgi:hypothetical protein
MKKISFQFSAIFLSDASGASSRNIGASGMQCKGFIMPLSWWDAGSWRFQKRNLENIHYLDVIPVSNWFITHLYISGDIPHIIFSYTYIYI